MKKLLTIFLALTLCFISLTATGCKTVFDGKYNKVSVDEAMEFTVGKAVHSIEKGNIKIDISANVYGEKSKTTYEIARTNNDLQMHGNSNPLGIETEFYYTGGYIYALSRFDGDVHKVRQQIALSEAVFGTTRIPAVDDRIMEDEVFDIYSVMDYYKTNDDSEYYIEKTDDYDKLKIVLTTSDYYPAVDHTITTTTTITFVYGKYGNYLASRVNIKDVRVSRKYKETSNITFSVERFEGTINLPSAEELEKYLDA